MKIFLVIGSTGEYSDREEWYVAAYRDRSKADAHCEAALKHLVPWQGYGKNARRKSARSIAPSPYDPHVRMDYTGTEYYVADVDLRDELPLP